MEVFRSLITSSGKGPETWVGVRVVVHGLGLGVGLWQV